jgi:predicted outer membrane repeat protein
MSQRKSKSPTKGQRSVRDLLRSGIGAALALGAAPALAANHPVASATDAALRQAIADANADVSPPVIVDASAISGTISLSGGQLDITNGMTILGPGSGSLTIDANDASRIFYVNGNVSGNGTSIDVTISGVTLNGGNALQHNGGAILSTSANLTLSHSVLSGNTTGTAANTNYRGGAVYAVAAYATTLSIDNTTFSNNSANYSGGAVAARSFVSAAITQSDFENNTAGGEGGALYLLQPQNATLSGDTIANNHNGTNANGFDTGGGGVKLGMVAGQSTELSYCTIRDNSDVNGFGGGLYVNGGSTRMLHSLITGNSTTGAGNHNGGGIAAYRADLYVGYTTVSGNSSNFEGGGLYASYSTLAINHSTVSGNTASRGGGGGGIKLNNPAYNGGSGATISNSTISGNTAVKGAGLYASSVNDSVTLTNTTLAGNTALYGGGAMYSKVGNSGTGVLSLESCTIADNSAANAGGVFVSASANPVVLHDSIVAGNTATGGDPDLLGAFAANYNFFSDTGDATLTGGNNLIGDPQLGSLGSYGGPTATKLPSATSPVLGAGDPAETLNLDQRGYTRPASAGARIAIGAVERQTSEDTIFLDGFDGD